MSDSNRLTLAVTDQVTSVAIPPSYAISLQQNAVVLIWLRPGEEVNEPYLLRCLLPLSWIRSIRARDGGGGPAAAMPTRKIMTRRAEPK
jgi:hypothetical protein